MMKKRIYSLMVVCMMGAVLTACGGDNSAADISAAPDGGNSAADTAVAPDGGNSAAGAMVPVESQNRQGNVDPSLLYGDWSLPYNNRAYMSFFDNGIVEGYEYMGDHYVLEGDKLVIAASDMHGEERYTVARLDDTWLGLIPEGSSEAVYSYRADSGTWEIDPVLCNKDYTENWVAENPVDPGVFYGGFHFGGDDGSQTIQCYFGEPDISEASWDMAATALPGGIIAKDGKIMIYSSPDSCETWDYAVDEVGVLHIHDNGGGGDYTYIKKTDPAL